LNLLWFRDVRKRLSLFPSRQGYVSLLLPTAVAIFVLLMARAYLKLHIPDIALVALAMSAGYAAFALVALRFSLDPQDKILAASAYARIRGMFAS